ncbi:uncharacterized protein LOC128740024 [Sabethes cyaneus]|uniref:uncharacterized protein LOC128740024 n=1 Tax=Sabethes cyaneus TaxID=53552 RepID=UPI00237DF96B|nr:uncharacterized protein LOC128740024 [Sabethes cyaneus]
MRTTLDLLRPTQIAETVNINNQDRQFSNNDLVYVQVHKRNDWYWEPGNVIERIGSVNYNVWLCGKRSGLIRSHVNQIRPRYDSANTEAEFLNKHLPLSVLLEEVGIRQQPTEPSPEAVDEHAQEQLIGLSNR